MATSGRLQIHVHEAKLTRDTETFGKMDPYIIFETREQRHRTKTAHGAGKHPNWHGEVIAFDVKYIGDDLQLKIFDEDPGTDDIVGAATIKLSAFCHNGGIDDWFAIHHHGREAGTVHLRTIFHPAAISV